MPRARRIQAPRLEPNILKSIVEGPRLGEYSVGDFNYTNFPGLTLGTECDEVSKESFIATVLRKAKNNKVGLTGYVVPDIFMPDSGSR